MKLVLAYYDAAEAALDEGAKVNDLVALPVREAIGRFKYVAEDEIDAKYNEIIETLKGQIKDAIARKEDF